MSRSFRAVLMIAIGLAAALIGGQAVPAAEPIAVLIDQAKLVKLPERVGTLVIGNPLIADASVQANGLLVITGKSYGATNLLALDRQGNVLMEKMVQVEGPRDVMVVYRGVERETYSCHPRCERRITLGDSNDFFSGALAQSSTRSSQAQGATAGR